MSTTPTTPVPAAPGSGLTDLFREYPTTRMFGLEFRAAPLRVAELLEQHQLLQRARTATARAEGMFDACAAELGVQQDALIRAIARSGFRVAMTPAAERVLMAETEWVRRCLERRGATLTREELLWRLEDGSVDAFIKALSPKPAAAAAADPPTG